LTAPLNSVPKELKANASQLRNAIENDEVAELCIWYVHNCPESKNVANEIAIVEHTAATAIKQINKKAGVRILAREFGCHQFAKLYRASGSPILVNADIKTRVPVGYQINGSDWSAYQTYIPGVLIYDLFSKHGTDLFSANVRDYLGSRESDANINNGIKETATTNPANFWVYNNGVTALVNGLVPTKRKAGDIQLTIKGISIVNGAQTTGAIGSLAKQPKPNLMVPIRFIWTVNKDRIQDIIVSITVRTKFLLQIFAVRMRFRNASKPNSKNCPTLNTKVGGAAALPIQ
jgi:AIPR protein